MICKIVEHTGTLQTGLSGREPSMFALICCLPTVYSLPKFSVILFGLHLNDPRFVDDPRRAVSLLYDPDDPSRVTLLLLDILAEGGRLLSW